MTWPQLKKKVWVFFAVNLVYIVYRLLISSWRIHVTAHPQFEDDLKNNRPVLFAHWHEDIIALAAYSKFYRIATIASSSSDGEIIAQVLSRLGLKLARGSSSKNGVSGLRTLIRLSRDRYILNIPVDGPRGPRHVPKGGVLELSKILKARIYPGGLASSNHHIFDKSWDKSVLPKPFSRVVLRWDEPIEPISENEDPRDPHLTQKLTEKLIAAGHQASADLKALQSRANIR